MPGLLRKDEAAILQEVAVNILLELPPRTLRPLSRFGAHGGMAIVLAVDHGEDGHLPSDTNAEEYGKEEERPGILRQEEEEDREGLHAETARHDLFAPDVVRQDRYRKPRQETAGIEGGIDASGQTRCEAPCHRDRR